MDEMKSQSSASSFFDIYVTMQHEITTMVDILYVNFYD